MRELILLRHGKAEPVRPSEDDHDRPLAPRGWDDAPLVAAALRAQGARPEIVLVSTARRCIETWKAIAAIFPDAAVETRETLYLAPPHVIEAAADAADAESIVVIGHNPGLQDLAASLAPGLEGAEFRVKFPTSAAAFFRRDADRSPWRLHATIMAKELRAPE